LIEMSDNNDVGKRFSLIWLGCAREAIFHHLIHVLRLLCVFLLVCIFFVERELVREDEKGRRSELALIGSSLGGFGD